MMAAEHLPSPRTLYQGTEGPWFHHALAETSLVYNYKHRIQVAVWFHVLVHEPRLPAVGPETLASSPGHVMTGFHSSPSAVDPRYHTVCDCLYLVGSMLVTGWLAPCRLGGGRGWTGWELWDIELFVAQITVGVLVYSPILPGPTYYRTVPITGDP